MSRIGNKPISIPAGVTIVANGNEITVTGKLGTLSRNIDSCIKMNIENNEIIFTRVNESKPVKAKHGLYRALVNNMVEGVTNGFKKTLIINGVGYKAQKIGNKLVLNIGFSHPVEFVESDGVTFEIGGTNEINCCGIDKEKVGLFASKIRDKRKCDPYHAYGIRYNDEIIKRKEGKKTGKK